MNDVKVTRKMIGSKFVAEISVVLAFEAKAKIQGKDYHFEKNTPLVIIVEKDASKLGTQAKRELDMDIMEIEREIYSLKWEQDDKKRAPKKETKKKEEDTQE